MTTRRMHGWQLALLWLVVLIAFGIALRRGSLVPWGSGAGPGELGAPLWSLAPLLVVAVVAAVLTLAWWRRRDRTG